MERLRSRAMSAGAPTIPPHQPRRRTLLPRAGIASGDCGLGGHRRPLARFYPAQACSWSSPELGVVYATPLHWRPIGGIGANPELWVGSKTPKSKGTDVGGRRVRIGTANDAERECGRGRLLRQIMG